MKPFAECRARIAVASSGLGHVARGIEAWAHDLGHALARRGVPVILCKGSGKADTDYERVVPCWTRESPQTKQVLARMPWFLGWRLGLGSEYGIEQTTFAWNLIKVLRREQIDLLHVQDPQVALLVQRARALSLVKTRTILAHGTEESFDFQKRIAYLQHLAPWHLEESKAAGVWRPTWTAIPNFIDTEQFSPGRADAMRRELDIPPDVLMVLSVSAIKRHHKRVDSVIDEFAMLRSRRPELPAWLVVAGGWESDTNELIAEGTRRLGSHVRFLVRFPRARMPELYRAANLFVLGSLKEMMPIALLEATASGLPCVVNRHPVMQWMIGPGGNAIDLSAQGTLATTLEALAASPWKRGELGRLARQYCVANFGRDSVVEQIIDYYLRVLMRTNCRTAAANVS